jgi:hypothetical protein
MMRFPRFFAFAVLAVLMLSAATPASAHINLLQNPGFEDGIMDPWDWHWGQPGDIWDGGVRQNGAQEGTYYAWIEVEESWRAIGQEIDPPQCAQYLEFYYRGGWSGDGGLGFEIHYSDKSSEEPELDPAAGWTLVHFDLDTAKLVELVEVGVGGLEGGIDLDDFDLEACSAVLVGGAVEPVNKLTVFAPYLALFGLVAAVAVFVAAPWKKAEN